MKRVIQVQLFKNLYKNNNDKAGADLNTLLIPCVFHIQRNAGQRICKHNNHKLVKGDSRNLSSKCYLCRKSYQLFLTSKPFDISFRRKLFHHDSIIVFSKNYAGEIN